MNLFARFFEFLNYLICANAVSAKADIGKGTRFWHRGIGIGCTVHYNAKIGADCKIFPNVMVGAKFSKGLPDEDAPRLGNNAIIAANSAVTKDVPDNCYVFGAPVQIKR